jgi:hypothetical protein
MLCFGKKKADDDDSSVEDQSASKLSHVGKAAYEVLRTKHAKYHKDLWNVTAGTIEGNVQTTPKCAFDKDSRKAGPPPREPGHDQWLAEGIGEMIVRTEQWCDILTLNPPDGLFVEEIRKALAKLCEREIILNRIVVRFMFGNIIGLPCNCNKLMADFTKDLPPGADKKLRIWVGAWRKGTSWNHSKIIAVDGKYLWTGGHNYWDYHYLRDDPVVDISIQLVGPCAIDGHYFANRQWAYIQRTQSTCRGHFIDKCISDGIELPLRERVSVTEWPTGGASEFPPSYVRRRKHKMTSRRRIDEAKGGTLENYVPVITLGRQGGLYKYDRPSDDAFIAMIESAEKSVKMSLQDLGPIRVPGTKKCLPGLKWPKKYFRALAKVLWETNVNVDIVLSNPKR